ncbi:hypothetical protein RO3G_14839 [Rhizopus delemar RA 99-880]|uniref:Uncharacterized protein n=3 Tax=Rhizopus TaxID=4842 RepID=I1CNU8_RHIO9|nr:hypothetical protein RO3G_14839 [Rhizopus delemar RA 99-880]|eukprot:EIE90128.1 hypothetical protein RO3G_14839 [Rhizopus delemar RA 99-880]
MRTVMKNINIIETILQVIHEDNLNFMAPNDSFIYDSGSDSSTASTISASSSSGEDWQAIEREEGIKERVNEAISMLNEQYQSQYVSTVWESNAFNDNN